MKLSTFLKRISAGDKPVEGMGASRTIVAWIFIALVALFLTQPSDQISVFDAPLPLPAELGLE